MTEINVKILTFTLLTLKTLIMEYSENRKKKQHETSGALYRLAAYIYIYIYIYIYDIYIYIFFLLQFTITMFALVHHCWLSAVQLWPRCLSVPCRSHLSRRKAQ